MVGLQPIAPDFFATRGDHMKRFFTAAALTLTSTLSAAADDYLGGYFTTIGPQDFYNSSGAKLGDFCAIIQQDRANFHRFAKRDQGDEADPFFGDRANRALIGQGCRWDREWTYMHDQIMSGNVTRVGVGAYGSGGRITYVVCGTTAG